MTKEEQEEEAEEWVISNTEIYDDKFGIECETEPRAKEAYLAGLRAGSENYSKIYMLGRKDERERPSDLCKNPISICKRCDCYKTLCEGSDFGAYIGECESFVYKETAE